MAIKYFAMEIETTGLIRKQNFWYRLDRDINFHLANSGGNILVNLFAHWVQGGNPIGFLF